MGRDTSSRNPVHRRGAVLLRPLALSVVKRGMTEWAQQDCAPTIENETRRVRRGPTRSSEHPDDLLMLVATD